MAAEGPAVVAEDGTSLISSFARIKPLESDKGGGTAGSKQIAGWKDASVSVSLGGSSVPSSSSSSSTKRGSGGGGDGASKTFGHMKAVIGPDATQEEVYTTVAQPLVRAWLHGYDCDLISYGQTGSGKTFTMFGPPYSMEKAAADLQGRGAEEVLKPEHGFILRSGLEALAAVEELNTSGGGAKRVAVLHGSMVELSIVSFTDQTVTDLLNKRQ